MTRNIVIAIVALVGLVLAMVWMQGGFHSKVPGGVTPAGEKGVAAKTVEAKTMRVVGQVTVSGSVSSREMARVASRISGNIVDVKADAGNSVKKGQVIVRIDSKEMTERVAQAGAALESAKADLSKARKDFDRFKALFEKESVSQKAFDDAKAGLDIAQGAENRVQAAYEEARTQLSYTEVVSPFDGVVAERFVNVGDLAAPGTPLMSIFMPGQAELVASAGEQYASFLKTDTPVKVEIPSVELKEDTKIREVVPQSHEKTRTITVKAPLTAKPGLRPGLYGTLSFATEISEVIMIPAAAIKIVGQLETVKVLEGSSIKIRQVKAGKKSGDSVEVLSGLNAGEKVVLE
ncbi:MAG: efflux RND transporter periplasmic adaptor subunit [Thermodesulfobacteriota bacterium]